MIGDDPLPWTRPGDWRPLLAEDAVAAAPPPPPDWRELVRLAADRLSEAAGVAPAGYSGDLRALAASAARLAARPGEGA